MVRPGQDPKEHLVELLVDLRTALENFTMPAVREEGMGPDGWHPATTPAQAHGAFVAQLEHIRLAAKKLGMAANGQVEALLADAPGGASAELRERLARFSGDVRVDTQVRNLEMHMSYSADQRDYSSALRCAEGLIARDPDHAAAHITRIMCLLFMQRIPEARSAAADLEKSNLHPMIKLRGTGLVEGWAKS